MKSDSCVDITNAQIVQLITDLDPIGIELLYKKFSRGLSYLAFRINPQQAEDLVHNTFIMVIDQIRKGELRNPEALSSYMNTILKRSDWASFKKEKKKITHGSDVLETLDTKDDLRHKNPQEMLEYKVKIDQIKYLMLQLNPEERQIMQLFYGEGKKGEEIIELLGITETQYRLKKSRTKAKIKKLNRIFEQQKEIHASRLRMQY